MLGGQYQTGICLNSLFLQFLYFMPFGYTEKSILEWDFDAVLIMISLATYLCGKIKEERILGDIIQKDK